MTTLDEFTVVVSSDSELREAITGVNTFNYIYFDKDITLTSGIAIPISKPNLTIDGTYLGIRHKYTDMDSVTAINSIYINSLNSTRPTMNVTVKNIDLIGRNYYGIIYVYDSTNAQNVTTTYENINYVGCQITYNNYGTTEYIDSTIMINNTTSSLTGEIGEVHKVIIGGKTTITHTFSGYNGFYFRGGSDASFTILPDAEVNISLARNLFAGDNNLASMTFGANSICTITAPYGLSYDSAQRTSSVLIDVGATLNVYRTSATGGATLYVDNNFTINDNANVLIKSTVNMSSPHLYFYTTNANFIINNPASCIFYNSDSPNFYFTGTTNINFKSFQINQWNTAIEIGDIFNLPLYQWIKNNHGQIEFIGTATNTATTISSNNLDPTKDVNLPNINLFQLRDLRVLSLGFLPLLAINRVINTATTVSGKTVSNAGLKVDFKDTTTYGEADLDGIFEIAISKPFITDDKIVITNSNNNFLYNIVEIIVEDPGELTLIIVPETMLFSCNNPLKINPVIYGRDLDGWTIQVYDSRVYSSDWTLTATINQDLKCDSTGHTLPHSLVFIDDSSMTELSSTPILVFTGENNEGVIKTTNVSWSHDKGILLKIDTVPIFIGDVYMATINWTLQE